MRSNFAGGSKRGPLGLRILHVMRVYGWFSVRQRAARDCLQAWGSFIGRNWSGTRNTLQIVTSARPSLRQLTTSLGGRLLDSGGRLRRLDALVSDDDGFRRAISAGNRKRRQSGCQRITLATLW